jgi:Protein of unknown function (DUF2764)
MSKYVTLMASLPPLGQLFEAKQTPISRIKLESRLKMLAEKDMALLNQMLALIAWQHQPIERTDAQLILAAQRFFEQVDNPTLRELIAFCLNVRTILAALCRRQRGETSPPLGQPWGVGPWVSYIERHWTEPGFRLQGMLPAVLAANRLLDANDAVGLERLQFEMIWKMLDRVGQGHYFDFEAVVIYLMRWDLIDRWTRYSGDAAVERFRKLVDAGIEEFTDVFA